MSTEKGFEYGPVITLPGIDTKVRVPRDVWFQDAGVVASVAGTVLATERQLRGAPQWPEMAPSGLIDKKLNQWLDKLLDWAGLSPEVQALAKRMPTLKTLNFCCSGHPVNDNGTTAYVLAQSADLDPTTATFARGFTSAQFLDAIDATAPKNGCVVDVNALGDDDPVKILATTPLASRDVLQRLLEAEGISLKTAECDPAEFAKVGGLLAVRKAAAQGSICTDGVSLMSLITQQNISSTMARDFGF